jgi:hypothetical protein
MCPQTGLRGDVRAPARDICARTGHFLPMLGSRAPCCLSHTALPNTPPCPRLLATPPRAAVVGWDAPFADGMWIDRHELQVVQLPDTYLPGGSSDSEQCPRAPACFSSPAALLAASTSPKRLYYSAEAAEAASPAQLAAATALAAAAFAGDGGSSRGLAGRPGPRALGSAGRRDSPSGGSVGRHWVAAGAAAVGSSGGGSGGASPISFVARGTLSRPQSGGSAVGAPLGPGPDGALPPRLPQPCEAPGHKGATAAFLHECVAGPWVLPGHSGTQHTLLRLRPFTAYRVRVRVHTLVGWSSFSAPTVFHTAGTYVRLRVGGRPCTAAVGLLAVIVLCLRGCPSCSRAKCLHSQLCALAACHHQPPELPCEFPCVTLFPAVCPLSAPLPAARPHTPPFLRRLRPLPANARAAEEPPDAPDGVRIVTHEGCDLRVVWSQPRSNGACIAGYIVQVLLAGGRGFEAHTTRSTARPDSAHEGRARPQPAAGATGSDTSTLDDACLLLPPPPPTAGDGRGGGGGEAGEAGRPGDSPPATPLAVGAAAGDGASSEVDAPAAAGPCFACMYQAAWDAHLQALVVPVPGYGHAEAWTARSHVRTRAALLGADAAHPTSVTVTQPLSLSLGLAAAGLLGGGSSPGPASSSLWRRDSKLSPMPGTPNSGWLTPGTPGPLSPGTPTVGPFHRV